MLDRAIDAQNAAIEAPNTKPDSDEMREYDAFLFMFANTLLHEIAHVLTTCLTGGKELTPPDVPDVPVELAPPNVPLPDEIETAGEAGSSIEHSAFGGIMYYMHDPDHVTPMDTVCPSSSLRSKASRLKSMLMYTAVRHGLRKEGRRLSSSQAGHDYEDCQSL